MIRKEQREEEPVVAVPPWLSGITADGEGWIDMIKSRNQTSHSYNEETANEITEAILDRYCAKFSQFWTRFARLRETES